MPGVPATAYVNDIKADNFDVNKVYAVLDNHKYGDYQPYIYVSNDKGRTWKSITSNLPDRTLTWRIVQDHVEKNLFFAATEYGIYFSVNAGKAWSKLNGGVPTISFRDLAIHKRENDLVGASFGRGFYVFDDISVFRELSNSQMKDKATLFSVRKAWWYIARPYLGFNDPWNGLKGSQGDSYFVAPNPPFGAVFTYHLSESLLTKKEVRTKKESTTMKRGKSVGFPGWKIVESENRELDPKVIIEVKDSNNEVVRRLEGPASKGFHRIAWDLRYPSPNAIMDGSLSTNVSGFLAPPGKYRVSIFTQIDGKVTKISDSKNFDVVPLRKGALETESHEKIAKFWRQYEQTAKRGSAIQFEVADLLKKVNRMYVAMGQSTGDVGDFDNRLSLLRESILQMDEALNGNRSKMQPGEKTNPTATSRLAVVHRIIEYSTYGPTKTAIDNLSLAVIGLDKIQTQLNQNNNDIESLLRRMEKAGAPWIEGAPIPKK